jgi:hypothetical protein
VEESDDVHDCEDCEAVAFIARLGLAIKQELERRGE